MYGSSSSTAREIPPAPPQLTSSERPLAEATLELIRSARQRVETFGMRATNLGDRIFGSTPVSATGKGETNEPRCAAEAFERELKSLHNAIDYLDVELQRVERVA